MMLPRGVQRQSDIDIHRIKRADISYAGHDSTAQSRRFAPDIIVRNDKNTNIRLDLFQRTGHHGATLFGNVSPYDSLLVH
jgi:hypothetical protein